MSDLRKRLEDLGFKPESYSGRGMFGRSCVGLQSDDLTSMFSLGKALGSECEASDPHIENLGMGFILYWPDEPWENKVVKD